MKTNLNVLIGSWSFVWGLALLSLANIQNKGFSIFNMIAGENKRPMLEGLVYWAPVLTFIPWAIGCALIILAHRYLLERKN